MIVLFALLGLVVGWLSEIASDYLLRFSSTPITHEVFAIHRPALFTPKQSGKALELSFELFTAGMFALLYGLHGLSGETFWLMGIYSFFAVIAIMDYKYRIILNILTYPGLLIALATNLVVLHQPISHVLLGVVFGFGVFYLAARVKPGGLGGGDVKLAALIGAALGFPNILFALIVTASASASAIIFMLVARKSTAKTTIPYAPFLSLGVMVVLMLTL